MVLFMVLRLRLMAHRGLSLGWHLDVTVNLHSFSQFQIDVAIREIVGESEWRFTRFYGSPNLCFRFEAWTIL